MFNKLGYLDIYLLNVHNLVNIEHSVSNKILSPKKDGVEVFYVNDDLLRILGG